MRNDLDLDPEGRRLPIKVDSASNGEHMPLALTVAQERANALAQQRIGEAARAELGSVWRHYMSEPDQAAHVIGKLLAHFGEERICWGRTASGTAVPRTRSRPSAVLRSPPSSRGATAIRR